MGGGRRVMAGGAISAPPRGRKPQKHCQNNQPWQRPTTWAEILVDASPWVPFPPKASPMFRAAGRRACPRRRQRVAQVMLHLDQFHLGRGAARLAFVRDGQAFVDRGDQAWRWRPSPLRCRRHAALHLGRARCLLASCRLSALAVSNSLVRSLASRMRFRRLFAALDGHRLRQLGLPQRHRVHQGRVDLGRPALLSFSCTSRIEGSDCIVTCRVSRRSWTRRSRSSRAARRSRSSCAFDFHLIGLGCGGDLRLPWRECRLRQSVRPALPSPAAMYSASSL